MVQELVKLIAGQVQLSYLVLDGHFSNHPDLEMVRECGLHLISKLRSDAAISFVPNPILAPITPVNSVKSYTTNIFPTNISRKRRSRMGLKPAFIN